MTGRAGSCRFRTLLSVFLVLAECAGTGRGTAKAQEQSPATAPQAFLTKHCVACHAGTDAAGGLDLTRFSMELNDPRSLDRAVRIHDRVLSGEMPPDTEERPNESQRGKFLTAMETDLIHHERRIEAESGRTVLRRLNRVEYENTVRELVGVEVNVRDILPPDTPSHGFDTVAESLRLSPLQMEKYLEAADLALDSAIDLTEAPERFDQRLSLKNEKAIRENLDTPEGTIKDSVARERHRVLFRELPDAVVMFSTGYPPGDFRQFNAPASGQYRIRVSGFAYQSHGIPATLRLFAHRFREKRLLGFYEMPEESREVEIVVHLDRNEVVQVVPYGVGFDRQGRGIWNVGAGEFEGSGLALQWLEIEGPLGEWPPTSVKRLYPDVALREIPKNERRWREKGTPGFELASADAEADARRVIDSFAGRAFRRPLEENEAEPFVKLALEALRAGRPFEEAARLAFRALLTSPQFLFLEEQAGPLSDHALASRLSYFLTSGPPDDELLALAAKGALRDGEVLRSQTERLLSSPRSIHFVRNFTGQWLDLRNIKATSPDRQLYPEFDEMLELSMVGETEAFFAEMLARNEKVENFVHSDFLMLNRKMAQHYGIEGVMSEQFQRVALPQGSPRGGVLTQAAVLKVTANGTVTSPVMRGAWVQKRLMGRPPQPPPPNVGAVEPDTRGATTIRELLDKHRNSETCAVCHRHIDPPGFALESFDVIGGWRDRYRSLGTGDKPTWKFEGRDIWEYKLGPVVDASGALPDGRAFQNITDFKRLLLNEKPQILLALTANLLTYSTGAGIRFSDRAEVDRVVTVVGRKDYGLRTLVHEVVQSQLFRNK